MKFRDISLLVGSLVITLLLWSEPAVAATTNTTLPSVPLPVTHQVTTCQLEDTSQPNYAPQYVLSSGGDRVNNIEFVVPPFTRGCLLAFMCDAVDDTTTYHEDQVMTVRASVNSFLAASLYSEDGSVLVPHVSVDGVATTTINAPTTLYVAFQDNGVSKIELGRIALSLQCIKAKKWVGTGPNGSPLPNATLTNIVDNSTTISNLLTSSEEYKSWVTPTPSSSGSYPTNDRKAYFFTCPIVPDEFVEGTDTFRGVPLLISQYKSLSLTTVEGWTDQPPDELYMVNIESSVFRLFYKVVNFVGSDDASGYSSSGAGFYAVWGSGPDAESSVPGISVSYTCTDSQWSYSGISVPQVVTLIDSWFTTTRVILIVFVALLFFLPVLLGYFCCCRTSQDEEEMIAKAVAATAGGGGGLVLGGSSSVFQSQTDSAPSEASVEMQDTVTANLALDSSSSSSTKDTTTMVSCIVDRSAKNKRESDRLFEAITAPAVKPIIPTKAAKGHNPLKAQAALLGMHPVQYFPNKTSTRTPWVAGSSSGAASVISSSSSNARPPSDTGTNEYKSEIGSTVGSSTVGSDLSSLRRSPQQQPQAHTLAQSSFASVDVMLDLEESIAPHRPVSPHLRGNPLPGLSALGGGGGGMMMGGGGARGGGFFPAGHPASGYPLPADREASTATINAFQVRRGGSPARSRSSTPTSPATQRPKSPQGVASYGKIVSSASRTPDAAVVDIDVMDICDLNP